jgi:hypothetical protein
LTIPYAGYILKTVKRDTKGAVKMTYTLNSNDNYGLNNGIDIYEIEAIMGCTELEAKKLAKIINKDASLREVALSTYIADPNPESHFCHINDAAYAEMVANKTYEGHGTIDGEIIKTACIEALKTVTADIKKMNAADDEYEAHRDMMRRAMEE